MSVYLIYKEGSTAGARSEDGITWVGFTSSHPAGDTLRQFSSDGGFVYMVSSNKLCRSEDGETWEELPAPFVPRSVYAVDGAIYTKSTSTSYVGTWVTLDNGLSWTKVLNNLAEYLMGRDGKVFGFDTGSYPIQNSDHGSFTTTGAQRSSFGVHGYSSHFISLGGGSALITDFFSGYHGITHDYGSNWLYYTAISGAQQGLMHVVQIDGDNLVSLTGAGGQVYRRASSDGGVTWANQIYITNNVYRTGVDKFAGRWIIPAHSKVMVSDDQGFTLSQADIPANMNGGWILGFVHAPPTPPVPTGFSLMWTNHVGQREY